MSNQSNLPDQIPEEWVLRKACELLDYLPTSTITFLRAQWLRSNQMKNVCDFIIENNTKPEESVLSLFNKICPISHSESTDQVDNEQKLNETITASEIDLEEVVESLNENEIKTIIFIGLTTTPTSLLSKNELDSLINLISRGFVEREYCLYSPLDSNNTHKDCLYRLTPYGLVIHLYLIDLPKYRFNVMLDSNTSTIVNHSEVDFGVTLKNLTELELNFKHIQLAYNKLNQNYNTAREVIKAADADISDLKAKLEKERRHEVINIWRDVIINELHAHNIYDEAHATNPQKALRDVININIDQMVVRKDTPDVNTTVALKQLTELELRTIMYIADRSLSEDELTRDVLCGLITLVKKGFADRGYRLNIPGDSHRFYRLTTYGRDIHHRLLISSISK